MKIKTTYIPTDAEGKAFVLPGVYTLVDIQKLGADLISAGVSELDVMSIQLDQHGVLSLVVEKSTSETATS